MAQAEGAYEPMVPWENSGTAETSQNRRWLSTTNHPHEGYLKEKIWGKDVVRVLIRSKKMEEEQIHHLKKNEKGCSG